MGGLPQNRRSKAMLNRKIVFQKAGVAWSSAAFFVAVIAIAALLGIVIYLFIRWRNTGQRTVSASATPSPIPNKNLEGVEEKAPLETTIGETGEVVENVAQLAKRYAMGTPSEKEFQRLKGLISHS